MKNQWRYHKSFNHISSMHFPEEKAFKSLAIMSCGNDNFGNQVKASHKSTDGLKMHQIFISITSRTKHRLSNIFTSQNG